MKKFFAVFLISVIPSAFSATYICTPSFQSVMGKPATSTDFVKKHKPITKVIESNGSYKVQRCSIPYMQENHTCDIYNVDRIERDVNVKIQKFYVFNAQYDIQIFTDLSFIDNNGRGGFLIGKCSLS